MKITAAFLQRKGHEDEQPELVSAYDDITQDAWGGPPDFYTEDIKREADEGDIRVLILEVPGQALTDLFATPKVTVETTPAN